MIIRLKCINIPVTFLWGVHGLSLGATILIAAPDPDRRQAGVGPLPLKCWIQFLPLHLCFVIYLIFFLYDFVSVHTAFNILTTLDK